LKVEGYDSSGKKVIPTPFSFEGLGRSSRSQEYFSRHRIKSNDYSKS